MRELFATMPDGTKKQYTKKGDDKTHARKQLRELEDKYNERGNKGIEGERLTFSELAAIYEKRASQTTLNNLLRLRINWLTFLTFDFTIAVIQR